MPENAPTNIYFKKFFFGEHAPDPPSPGLYLHLGPAMPLTVERNSSVGNTEHLTRSATNKPSASLRITASVTG